MQLLLLQVLLGISFFFPGADDRCEVHRSVKVTVKFVWLEVFTALLITIMVFWDYPDDLGGRFLRNVGN
jgi:hypothetical protein